MTGYGCHNERNAQQLTYRGGGSVAKGPKQKKRRTHKTREVTPPLPEAASLDALGLEAVIRDRDGVIAGTIPLHERMAEDGRLGLYGVSMVTIAGRRFQCQTLAVRNGDGGEPEPG